MIKVNVNIRKIHKTPNDIHKTVYTSSNDIISTILFYGVKK